MEVHQEENIFVASHLLLLGYNGLVCISEDGTAQFLTIYVDKNELAEDISSYYKNNSETTRRINRIASFIFERACHILNRQ